MMECGDVRCKKKLDDLDEFVRGGKEPHTGIVGEIEKLWTCCKDKIPKGWIWKFTVVFGIFIISGAYYIIHKVDSSDYEFIGRSEAQVIHDTIRAESKTLHEAVMKIANENHLTVKIIEERNNQQYANICSQLSKIDQTLAMISRRIDRIERKATTDDP